MTISSERLLPCPFCGGPAIWHDIQEEDEVSNFGGSVIVCTKCDACSAVEFDQKDTLIERWNRRSGREAVIEECAKVADGVGEAYGMDETGWLDCSETIAMQIRTLKDNTHGA